MNFHPFLRVSSLCILALGLLRSASLGAQVPAILSYQGRLVVANTNYDGVAEFQFALVDATGATSYWSNDGSSVAGSRPGASLPANVSKGLYSVLLGDTSLPGMAPIPPTVFSHSDVRLRVWFRAGTPDFRQLDPDQRFAAVGYALMAAEVADGSVNGSKIASGAVDNTKLANSGLTVTPGTGLAGGGLVSLGGNVSLGLANGGVGNAQLAANAVQTANLADGVVSNAKLANPSLTVTAGNGLTGGGSVALGGAVNLNTTATAQNTPSAIVQRDGAGNFSAGTITATAFAGVLHVPGNTNTGGWATIGGGHDNLASGESSTVAGGTNNHALGTYSAIGGGAQNTADGFYATVGGGTQNSASGTASTVSGGFGNAVAFDHSTVGGGAFNQALGAGSTISGGLSNVATNTYAAVGGGRGNQAGGSYSTVGGGFENIASSSNSTIGGGEQNHVDATHATIGGGERNTNTVCTGGTISGGRANSMFNADYAAIGGGYQNYIGDNALGATVPGGMDNQALGLTSFAAGRQARAVHNGAFVWADSTGSNFASSNINQFLIRASGGTGIFSDAAATTGVFVAPGGNAWNVLSDRHAKENFTAVNYRDLLTRLDTVPVTTWNLKSQDAAIRHIGPMAQDFQAAFAVGEEDRHISTSDADGVAFAAIKGLRELLREKDAEVAELKAANGSLAKRLAAIERRLDQLANAAALVPPTEDRRLVAGHLIGN